MTMTNEEYVWYLDSGATCHVIYALELAKNLLLMACIASKGCKLTINLQGCSIFDQ